MELFPAIEYDEGKVPSVSINVHFHNNAAVVNGHGGNFHKGTTPDVALTDDGTVIEVHETNNIFSNDTYYHVGTVDASSKTIKWGPSHRYSEGKTPSVAVNGKGVVVELHGSSQLWYHVGALQAHQQSISWGDSKKYETGMSPCVAINNRGQIIEVHESEGLLRRLWCNVGNADLSNGTILWNMPSKGNASLNYSQGITPAAAITTEGKVVEVHALLKMGCFTFLVN